MKLLPTLLLALTSLTAAAELGIETTHKVDCTRKTKKHDTIQMHYRGTLAADGSEFDASYKRGQPLRFILGAGRVIKGFVFSLSGSVFEPDSVLFTLDSYLLTWLV